MKRFALGLLFALWGSVALAQGCGPQNPNCIVPTAPVGIFDSRAASGLFVQQNAATQSFVQQNAFTVVTPDAFCTVDRTGAADMGTCINSAITASVHCGAGGNGVVHLSAGTYLVTTPVVPKSCVSIIGDGSGETVFLTNAAAPFAQASGNQLVHFRLKGVTFKDSGTHASAVVMTFTSIMGSTIEDIEFGGYTSGTLMSIAGATNSTFSDSSGVWGGNSNSFFNSFSHWTSRDGCGKCVMMAGAYGGTPTASPVNSSNAPSIVVTQNDFWDMNFWGVTTNAWDFIKAVDTVNIRKSVVLHNTNSGVSIQIGDDNANFPGNNYVNGIRAQISISANAGVTGTTFFRAGDWTFGNAIDLETDMAPSNFTLATAQASVTMFKLDMCGKNSQSGLLDALGFNTNRLCIAGNFGSSNDGGGTFYRFNNGSASTPILGFTNDSANGPWLCAASFWCFTKGVQTGTATIATGQIGINGITSGQALLTVPAAAGTPTVTFGSSSGTPAVTASAPLTINAATGNITFDTTAWAAFTPSFTCASGTWTPNSARFKTIGKTTFIEIDATLGGAACTGATSFTLPNTSQSTGTINGQETVTTNAAVACRFIGGATATATCVANGGSNFTATSRIVGSGVYENQ
jgi:hypothetical protein